MSVSKLGRGAEILLLMVGGVAFAAMAAWRLASEGQLGPNAFLLASLALCSFIELWRGGRRSGIVLSGCVGLYFWWNAAVFLHSGVAGFAGRTGDAALVSRDDGPAVFWLLLAACAGIGLLAFAHTVRSWRAGRRRFG